MLEFLAPKKKQFFKAQWISGEDNTKNGFFKFSKGKETQNKINMNSMETKSGNTVWESKTTLPLKADDTCIFNGQKYFIVSVDVDDSESQEAHLIFIQNGNVNKIITLSKAG